MNQPQCLFCEATSQEVPLVSVTYKDRPMYICSQHLPLLIHEPAKLAAQLEKKAQQDQ